MKFPHVARFRYTYAAFLWGRELVFTGSKLLSNYWRRLIFLQLSTCDHELSSSRECFGTVFVLVYMVNTSSRPQRNAALYAAQFRVYSLDQELISSLIPSLLILLLFLLGPRSSRKAQGLVISNPIGMKISRILLPE